MQTPLQIAFQGMPPSPAIEARIRARTDRLERMFEKIDECQVVVEAQRPRGSKDVRYRVKIWIVRRGRDVKVGYAGLQDRVPANVYVAVREAFKAAERRLAEPVPPIRGNVVAYEPPLRGRVGRLLPDYGFVVDEEGNQIFFLRDAVVGDFGKLRVGEEVRVAVVYGSSAAGPKATTVAPIGGRGVAS